jgi:hypothetical protein
MLLLFLMFGLLLSLAWVAFVSWLVARFGFRDEPPRRRAAFTAGTSLAICCGIQLLLALLFGPAWLRAVPFLAAAAFLDFLMLWRGFERKWVSEDDVADAFR